MNRILVYLFVTYIYIEMYLLHLSDGDRHSQHCENFFQNSYMIIAHIPHGEIRGPKKFKQWERERRERESGGGRDVLLKLRVIVAQTYSELHQ